MLRLLQGPILGHRSPALLRLALPGRAFAKLSMSINRMDSQVILAEERHRELLRAEMEYLATIPPDRLTMREVFDCLHPALSAKMIMKHVPRRFAATMRIIENLPGWNRVPELVSRHSQLNEFYESLQLVGTPPIDLKDFTSVVKQMRVNGRGMVSNAISGIFKVHRDSPKADRDAVDDWLDQLFLLRIGHNMLVDQHIACTSVEDGGLGSPTGIIDLRCDVSKVCKQAALEASQACFQQYGREPQYSLENYSSGSASAIGDSPCMFTYIPHHLHYILLELFRNAFQATLEHATDDGELRRRPVQISVCRDRRRILIRVRDQAGGIPVEVGEGVWSYMHWCAAREHRAKHRPSEASKDEKIEEAMIGGGGLPLSRQFARYLGGDLEIRSLPGFGTDARLFLPRLDSELVERVPSANGKP
mmetsp:Transcript_38843/g.85066  ORF Transcript_38843/g.85066 Transcript_38843/m.85066 type:complete len:419 (-) Transcript_38843:7-1263(-)